MSKDAGVNRNPKNASIEAMLGQYQHLTIKRPPRPTDDEIRKMLHDAFKKVQQELSDIIDAMIAIQQLSATSSEEIDRRPDLQMAMQYLENLEEPTKQIILLTFVADPDIAPSDTQLATKLGLTLDELKRIQHDALIPLNKQIQELY